MKVTINYIAELAGVSRGTVDKVIHERPGVRPAVREHVMQVIRQTGYQPIHRSLEPTSKTVAVIMPRTTDTYFAALKAELDARCDLLPDLTLRYHFCESTDIDSQLAALQHPADAWLIRGVRSERLRIRLKQLECPIFFLDAEVPGVSSVCTFCEDNYQGGRIAASLLSKCMGRYGKAAVLAGSPEIASHCQRLDGFLDYLQEHCPEIEVVAQLFSQDQSVIAYTQACRTLDQFPELKGFCNLAGYAGEFGQAMLQRKRPVKMVCYDSTADVAALIQKGIVEFSISLLLSQQAGSIINTLYDYLLRGIPPIESCIQTPVTVLFDESLGGILPDGQK